jgi:hypothetical protein
MSEERRSDRKPTQTDFLGLTQTPPKGQAKAISEPARRARKAAVASAYEPLVGLKQLRGAISIDAVPGVFATGLLSQHPICYNLFNQGFGVQGNATPRYAAAAAARSALAVQKIYERFEAACDDLDSGLFSLDQRHCYCCMRFFAGAGGSQSHLVGGHV